MVSARRHKHRLPARARRRHLGRVGRRRRQSRPGLRQAVARLDRPRRPTHRPDPAARRRHPPQSRLAPPHRERVERGRSAGDGAAAVPRLFPVLGRAATGRRRKAPPLVPALPALGRRLSRRRVQRGVVRALDPPRRPAVRPRRGRLRLDRRRLPPLPQPSQARPASSSRATPLPLPTLRLARRPDSIDGYTPADIELVGYQHHAALPAPVAV